MNKTGLLENFVDAGGFKTRYLEGGSARDSAVLLLHDGGFGASAETSWGAVAPQLVKAGYYVLVPEMLGFGGTDKAFFFDRSPIAFRAAHIKSFCDAKKITAAHFIGTSFGGTLTMRALVQRTWPFASACSIAGTGGPWRVPAAMAALNEYDGSAPSMSKIVEMIADPQYSGFDFQDYLTLRHKTSLIPGHYAALVAVRLSAPWEQAAPSAQADAYPGSLANCKVPLLLVEAMEDPTCQPGWTENIRSVLPTVEVRKISGRHSPNVDRPSLVTDVILNWLRSQKGSDRAVS